MLYPHFDVMKHVYARSSNPGICRLRCSREYVEFLLLSPRPRGPTSRQVLGSVHIFNKLFRALRRANLSLFDSKPLEQTPWHRVGVSRQSLKSSPAVLLVEEKGEVDRQPATGVSRGTREGT